MKTRATGRLRNFLRQATLPGAVIFCASSFCAQSWAARGPELGAAVNPTEPGSSVAPHSSAERNGAFETKDGLTLHLSADLGSVRIVPLEAGAAPAVRYTVHIETDARAAVAENLLDKYVLRAKATNAGVDIEGALPAQSARGAAPGAQFWVQFEVAVPMGYSLDIKTDAGDIETQDIGGTAVLTTQGGNIRTGRIGLASMRNVRNSASGNGPSRAMSKLRTEGGHIQVLDVAGDLNAFTGGGHINVGNVAGDATLRSGGGHIRAGQIGGRAELDTDGGNITVGHAGSFVNVRTGGGQIDFGEVRGSVRAQTAGGGIRIMYVAGPMEVESSGGSICLTRVAGAVQAATADGTITAWISPDQISEGRDGMAAAHQAMVQLAGASQLASGNGDIVVFLPRNLAANIDALVSTGGEQRIEADPALHLNFQNDHANGGGSVHAIAVLNGGGLPLKLRTTAGKIRLQYLDSDPSLRESRIREQQERLRVVDFKQPAPVTATGTPEGPAANSRSDWLEDWVSKLEVAFTGGLREDADDFRKRLTASPHPPYPELAQRVGIQGVVRLQVRVLQDGRVEVLKLLQGEPVLADAAITAVKQWRGKPAWVNGKPVEVISTVTFNFQLR
ncbi:MAG: energy transducer TonB [Acidobacteriota bacterium]|nr:energy transducer TonB [Acidobacteriota bacterium]